MIYSGKFDEILSPGLRDIVGTRICHADANANGTRTETNISLLTFGGGHNNEKLTVQYQGKEL